MQSQAGVDTGHRGEDRGPGETQRPRHRADQHLLCHHNMRWGPGAECSVRIFMNVLKLKFHDIDQKDKRGLRKNKMSSYLITENRNKLVGSEG